MHCRVTVVQTYLQMQTVYNTNVGLPNKLASKVQKRLLIVVVALGRDLMILKILLSVESDLLWLHLPVLDINLVATENNGDVLTHPALGGYISSVQGHDAQRVSDKVMLTDIGLYAMLVHSCM
jgi:hypothetical protein